MRLSGGMWLCCPSVMRDRPHAGALQEVDRPFDVEFDDDFEDNDALSLPGRRERTQKRRPGVITFDEDAAADR